MSGLTPGSVPRVEPPAEHEAREFATVDSDGTSFVAALRQRLRRAKAVRELKRLIRSAPTATIRNDLMTIAARNEGFTT